MGSIATSLTGFTQVSSVTNGDLTFDTGFANWRGTASPTGAFSSENGTVLFFSVVLTGVGNDLSLSDITCTESDTDTVIPNYFQFAGSFAVSNYAADEVGVLANGTIVSAGTAGSTLVH